MTLRTKLIVFLVVALLVVILFLAGVAAFTQHHSRRAATAGPVDHSPSAASITPAPGSAQAAEVDRDLALMMAMPNVPARTSKSFPMLGATASTQPDLYARAFADELLTQNYALDRTGLLAWVQAESATSAEPLVVGLVPVNLRSKLAVYSLSESSDGSAVPIPSAEQWLALRAKGARTSVQIQKVIEPVQWSDALDAGKLTDPSVTEREVDAVITTRWRTRNHVFSSTKSVAITMNLEGPPGRAGYGFVTSPVYTEVPG